MAAGVSTANWHVYEEQFFGGMTEKMEQNNVAFNQASNGAIRLVTDLQRGNYVQESFIKSISGLVARRDPSSLAAVAYTAIDDAELVRVKLSRKVIPVARTIDSWRKINVNPQTMSVLLGQQSAAAILIDYLNSALRAVRASITAVTALNYDGSAGNLSYQSLTNGRALFGDASARLACWVMHSKPFHDLFSDGLVNYKIDDVAGFELMTGNLRTMGLPVVVTDSPALVTTGSPNQYHTLGLVADAVSVIESEEKTIFSEIVGGLENLVIALQGEHAFTIGVKGAQWDIANGGPNPSDAALGTSTNWDTVATDVKSNAGIRILSD